jgi:hypothetical protein
MIKKWIDFIKENVVNPDSYIDIRMQEIRDLISNISTDYKFSWENSNDEKLSIVFEINGMCVKYTFDILSMNLTKYVGESIDFDIDVSSIDDGINQIDIDIKSLIGISERRRNNN